MTGGSGCSSGDGNACASSSRSFGAADAGRAAHAEHRIERPASDGLFEILDHDLHVDVLAGEVAVHQRLVFALGDDPFEQGVAGTVDGREFRGVRGRTSRRPLL